MKGKLAVFLALPLSIVLCRIAVSDVAPGWVQVNQDGFGYNASTSTEYRTQLFVFDNKLYAYNGDGLFQMNDPTTKNWSQLYPVGPAGPFEPGALKALGSYLYVFDANGKIWWVPEGSSPGGAWTLVTSVGPPGGANPEPMVVFNGQLYGVLPVQTDTFEIWRTPNIGSVVMNWSKVVSDGFGDPANNHSVNVMTVFNNRIYAGTQSMVGDFIGSPAGYGAGVEVWESPSGEMGSWIQVNQDGFGTKFQGCDGSVPPNCDFAIHQIIGCAAAYQAPGEAQGYLYIGTISHFGAEMWRYDGFLMDGWQNVTPPGAGVCQWGCGASRLRDMAVYQGDLYTAEAYPTANLVKYDGQGWSIVVSGPAPFDPDNGALESLAVYQNSLYVSTGHMPFSGVTQGDQVWQLAVLPPANDTCPRATEITVLPYSVTEDTTSATTAVGDPSPSCGNADWPQQSRSVWYRFTAPRAGTYSADTLGSSYDTLLAVFTGACGSLSEVACNDDATAYTRQSSVQWQAQEGTVYHIEVASYGTLLGGTLQLALTGPPPPNDNCAAGILLRDNDDFHTTNTMGATREPAEPTPTCAGTYSTVWYRLRPATGGVAILSTEGSDFDTVLAVYTGVCGERYDKIACNDDAIGGPPGTRWSAVAFNAAAGAQYFVQVGSYLPAQSGRLELQYHVGPPCSSISSVKCKSAGSRVTLCGKRIAGYPFGFPAIQEPDRSAGIYVAAADSSLLTGTAVTVIGYAGRTAEGNVYIEGPGGYVGVDAPIAVEPLGMSNRSVGGSAFCNQAGVPGASGLNNVGLWVRSWGKVISVDSSAGLYWIDDGSALHYGLDRVGLCVLTGQPLPGVGTFRTVTGMSWLLTLPGGLLTPTLVEPGP